MAVVCLVGGGARLGDAVSARVNAEAAGAPVIEYGKGDPAVCSLRRDGLGELPRLLPEGWLLPDAIAPLAVSLAVPTL
jgi:hypothetical protein